jgi:hypothetical protein
MLELVYDVNKCINIYDFINNNNKILDDYIGIDDKLKIFVIYHTVIGIKYGYYDKIEYNNDNIIIYVNINANDFYFNGKNNNIDELKTIIRKYKINKIKNIIKRIFM